MGSGTGTSSEADDASAPDCVAESVGEWLCAGLGNEPGCPSGLEASGTCLGTSYSPIRNWIEKIENKANMPITGRVHVLRHTFASHVAMAGVPAMTIKELARHSTLLTTMRYMHLSPSAKDEGIAMLAKSRAAGGGVVTSPNASGGRG